MKIRSKFLALVGAGALMMALSGTALAATENVDWTGNGVTDGQLNTSQCDESNTPFLFWVLSPSSNISAAELWVNGVDQGAMVPASDNGNPAFQLQTAYFDLDTITATAAITYDGDLANGLKLKISHGCAGTQATPTPGAPTPTPTFGIETAGITDAPSEPSTDSIGTSGTSGPADGAWLLVVALGVLLASIVVLTPARAKGQR